MQTLCKGQRRYVRQMGITDISQCPRTLPSTIWRTRLNNQNQIRSLTRCLAFLCASLCCGIANAATCFTNYCTDTVSQTYLNDTTLLIKLTNGLSGLTNCTPQAGGYITVPKTNANYNAYYAMVLSASLAKTTITIRTTDSSSPCATAYMYLTTP
jgi:hypothetical protein